MAKDGLLLGLVRVSVRVRLNLTTISPSSRHPVGKIPLAPNSYKNRLRINSCSAAFTFNVCPLDCMIPERQVSNSNYSNCTPYLATSGRLIMTLIDADDPRPLVMTGPRHSMALQ